MAAAATATGEDAEEAVVETEEVAPPVETRTNPVCPKTSPQRNRSPQTKAVTKSLIFSGNGFVLVADPMLTSLQTVSIDPQLAINARPLGILAKYAPRAQASDAF